MSIQRYDFDTDYDVDFMEFDSGGYVLFTDHAAAIADKDEEIARLKSKIDEMDQVQGLVCQDCGWAMKFPDEPCRNCECDRLRKVVEAGNEVERLREALEKSARLGNALDEAQ